MSRKRRRSLPQAEAECFLKCSLALRSFYSHPECGKADTEKVIGMLALRWVTNPSRLKVTLDTP